ncbi:MAG: tRNA uridine-5-carboxymethylaminomethyl(34) synthesis GTPase MnmE [Bacteroidales bacterium]|nr:tRNA uridine-5-carboxymethylaminomethyl(34) synthesis GTPase MnmE [Bacteroidales bacterium]
MKSDMTDSICATATPVGNGGISVIRLSGPRAVEIAEKVVRCRRGSLADLPSHRVKFVEFVAEEAGDSAFAGAAASGEVLDEGVVTLFRAPHSYTGEDVVELSCHASPYIVRRLLSVLTAAGARMAEPGEFTKRAFLNGRMDLSQAEAVADLIASENKASHDLAWRQLRGGVSNEMAALRARLVEFASLVELELDFSEEDVEFADRSALRTLLDEIAARVAALRRSFATGLALKEGVPVVLIGRPNAGKSTLLNRLLHEEKALVSEIPGTTRDTIEDVWEWEGVRYRFIDTAGLRESTDPLELAGMARTKEKMRRSRLWLYLFDASEMSAEAARAEASRWYRDVMGGEGAADAGGVADAGGGAADASATATSAANVSATAGVSQCAPVGSPEIGSPELQILLVGNKSDKLTGSSLEKAVGGESGASDVTYLSASGNVKDSQGVVVADGVSEIAASTPENTLVGLSGAAGASDLLYLSAKTGQGMDVLESRIKARCGLRLSENETVLTNARHAEVLGRLAETLNRILLGLTANLSGDLLAQDIREALRYIGEITGEVHPDELLGTIFSRFCIGK